jgi:CDP-diacylglycerol--glycerol-3-phosphate 3-phosphatidyltransferase
VSRLARFRKALAGYLTGPPVRLLARTPLTPNQLSVLGFLLAGGAAALIAAGHLVVGGALVLAAGLLDIIDGALARKTDRATRFGAVLDSTLDRLSEGVLLAGIMWLFLTGGPPASFLDREWSVMIVLAALLGSVLVSYIRARAETLGVDCQVGLFTRGERVVVLVLGLWLDQLVIALLVISLASFITAGQRLVYVWQQTR